LEYILATINNSSRSFDQVEEIVDTIVAVIAEQYKQKITEMFEPVAAGFHSVAKQAMYAVASVIFRDLEETMSKLFEKEWYESELLKAVVLTMDDYFKDIESFVVESYTKKLAAECLDRVVNKYVEQLFGKKHTLDQHTIQRMQDDEQTLRDFFSQKARKNAVSEGLQVLTDLRELLDAEPEMISLYFHSLLKNHPDVSLTIIAALLSMRYDLDRNQISEAIEGCSRIIEQREKEGAPRKEVEGVFSRIQLSQKISWYKPPKDIAKKDAAVKDNKEKEKDKSKEKEKEKEKEKTKEKEKSKEKDTKKK